MNPRIFKVINAFLTTLIFLMTATVKVSFANNIITAENLATLQSVNEVQVSPSGQFTAFTRSVPRKIYHEQDGKNWLELHVVNDKGEERPFITGKVNIKNIQWSADSRLLYFLSKRDEDKHNTLYQIAINGGQAQKVLALKNTNINHYTLSQDNKTIALLAKKAKDPSIKTLAELGFKAEVFEEQLSNQYLYLTKLQTYDQAISPEAWEIKEYVSDVHFSPNGTQLLIKTQASPLIDDKYMKSKWHIADIASQSIKNTLASDGKLGTASFSHDGQYIAFLGAEDKHDPANGRLFIAEVSNPKPINWLPDFQGHVADIEWSNQGNELFFIAHVGTQSIVAKLSPKNNQYTRLIDETQFIASHLSLSSSDKSLIIKASRPNYPSEVHMLRGNRQIRLTDSNPWLAKINFAQQESLTIKSRDGINIGGILIYPLNYKKDQRYPLIMVVHGGPESHDKDGWLTNYSRPGQLAAAQGYAVFYPNYRGSTGKGVAYSKLGQNDYAGKEFDDLVDFKNHLVNIGLVNDKKVGITGGSYGGYAAAWGATKLTQHFAASVMFVGIANQLSKFGTTDISNEMNLVHARSYPWDKWQWYLERSPIYWVEQSKTPLLIMHGKADPRVHPAQAMEMYRYMKVHGKTVRLVYYPNEGHGNKRAAAKYDYNLRLMRWMDNYLKHDNKPIPQHELPHANNLITHKNTNK